MIGQVVLAETLGFAARFINFLTRHAVEKVFALGSAYFLTLKGFIDMLRYVVDHVHSSLGVFCGGKKNCADVRNQSNRDKLEYFCIRNNSDQPPDRLSKNAKFIIDDIFYAQPEHDYLKTNLGVGWVRVLWCLNMHVLD